MVCDPGLLALYVCDLIFCYSSGDMTLTAHTVGTNTRWWSTLCLCTTHQWLQTLL